jgi:hypothetical protein
LLNLPLPELADSVRICDLIDEYFSEETLKMNCGGCDRKNVPQAKLIEVTSQPPRCLAIALKRFDPDGEKIVTPVLFEREINYGGGVYDMCALSMHDGDTPRSGHYYTLGVLCYVLRWSTLISCVVGSVSGKHPLTGRWLLFNDADAPVFIADIDAELRSGEAQVEGYTAFYQRVGPAVGCGVNDVCAARRDGALMANWLVFSGMLPAFTLDPCALWPGELRCVFSVLFWLEPFVSSFAVVFPPTHVRSTAPCVCRFSCSCAVVHLASVGRDGQLWLAKRLCVKSASCAC